jgi:hypothetical protein
MKSAYSCWVKSISCWAVAERASARGRALWMMLKVLRTQNQGVLRTLFRIWKVKAVAVQTLSCFVGILSKANNGRTLISEFGRWASKIRALSLCERSRKCHQGFVAPFVRQQRCIVTRAFHCWYRHCTMKLHSSMVIYAGGGGGGGGL